jgi:hypothetical protein
VLVAFESGVRRVRIAVGHLCVRRFMLLNHSPDKKSGIITYLIFKKRHSCSFYHYGSFSPIPCSFRRHPFPA